MLQMIVKTMVRLTTNRSSLENPSTPLTGARIDSILGGGRKSSAGVTVNADTVLSHAVIFRACDLVSSDVSKLPLFVYKNLPDGNREADRRHPASMLLRKQANPHTTAHTFLKTLVGHALIHRGGYAWIRRESNGRPIRLELLDPLVTFPVIAEMESGEEMLTYVTRSSRGQEMQLLSENVFHIKRLGGDGLDGYSIVDRLQEAIGLGLATQKFASVYFANSARPSIVIRFPGHLKDQEAIDRFRASWGNVHAGGPENAHKPAILEGGAEVQPFSMTNEDSQLLETRKLDVRTLSTVMGVPPHKVGDDTRTSLASLEQENQSYLDEAIDPWLREIETEANQKLLSQSENLNETHFVEFVRSAFVRTNLKDRMDGYTKGVQGGYMSRAQIRRLENWNVEEPGLEEFLQPLNMTTVGEEPDEDPPADDTDDSDAQRSDLPEHKQDARPSKAEQYLQTSCLRTTRTLMARLKHRAETAAQKPDRFLKWLDDDLRSSNSSMFDRDIGHFPTSEEVTELAFGTISRTLFDVSGRVTAPQLPEAVRQTMTELEADLPTQMTQILLQGVYHGPQIST